MNVQEGHSWFSCCPVVKTRWLQQKSKTIILWNLVPKYDSDRVYRSNKNFNYRTWITLLYVKEQADIFLVAPTNKFSLTTPKEFQREWMMNVRPYLNKSWACGYMLDISRQVWDFTPSIDRRPGVSSDPVFCSLSCSNKNFTGRAWK